MWNIDKLVSCGKYYYAVVPNHPYAIKRGYVFHHRIVVECYIGRVLGEKEVVHHRNNDGKDNHITNLSILTLSEHARFHATARGKLTGTIRSVIETHIGVVYPQTLAPLWDLTRLRSKPARIRNCLYCGETFRPFSLQYSKFCSPKCGQRYSRKVERPSKGKLSLEISQMTWVAIGKKYGVSDNAVRKWAKYYKIL